MRKPERSPPAIPERGEPGDDSSSLAEQIAATLTPFLGEFNARIAVKTFARRAFDIPPEELTPEHLPGFLEALRPSLKTLAGSSASDKIIQRIQREVK